MDGCERTRHRLMMACQWCALLPIGDSDNAHLCMTLCGRLCPRAVTHTHTRQPYSTAPDNARIRIRRVTMTGWLAWPDHFTVDVLITQLSEWHGTRCCLWHRNLGMRTTVRSMPPSVNDWPAMQLPQQAQLQSTLCLFSARTIENTYLRIFEAKLFGQLFSIGLAYVLLQLETFFQPLPLSIGEDRSAHHSATRFSTNGPGESCCRRCSCRGRRRELL